MAKTVTDNLAALREAETELTAELEAVRQGIQAALKKLPAEVRESMQPEATEAEDDSSRFMQRVLAELGAQFSAADIFQKARQLQPDLNRLALEKAVGKLQRSGAILKIQRGRGIQPARFQKAFR